MTKATVSSKGQIALPKAVRERLGLKPGTVLSIDVRGESLVMRRIAREFPDWHTMRGIVKSGPSLTKALEQEHAGELARSETRIKNRP